MGKGPRYRMPLKRRLEGKTDYRTRLNLIKSGKPRAVVRISNNNVIIQLVKYHSDGDQVIMTVTTEKLEDYGWKGSCANIPGAYLVGFLAGKKALETGIEEAVLDIGMNVPHPRGKLFAALKGMLEAGLDIPHSPDILPDDEKVKGEHINENIVKQFDNVKNNLEEL